MAAEFRVRPFEMIQTWADGVPAAKLSGTIAGSMYVLTLAGAGFGVPSERFGRDQWGEYAIVVERDVEVGRGFFIQIKNEADEPDDTRFGCSIRVYVPNPKGPEHRALTVTIDFNQQGVMDGWGAPSALMPPAAGTEGRCPKCGYTETVTGQSDPLLQPLCPDCDLPLIAVPRMT